MGEMREIFDLMKEQYKQRCSKRNEKFEPTLIDIGAIKKSNGVYECGEYFCYPTKGFAMHKKSYKKMNLEKFLERNKR